MYPHPTSIIDKYLCLTWRGDRLLAKGKPVQTHRLKKQVENIFFLKSLCMILTEELFSGMHFLNIPETYYKTVIFLLLSRLREKCIPNCCSTLLFVSPFCLLQGSLHLLNISSLMHPSQAAFEYV